MLTESQLAAYREFGQLTLPGMLDDNQVHSARAELDRWSEEFLAQLAPEQRSWYLEQRGENCSRLRKLDHPVADRPLFREFARLPRLVSIVEQLIGPGVTVFFSQVFLKPPEVGGPKPAHQDNFYFGPAEPDAAITCWLAIDDATPDNGCLHYARGSHQRGLLDHVAPAGEPFNLLVPETALTEIPFTPEPVPAGGISLHHGLTLHRSGNNTSPYPRRAVALHYLRNDVPLTSPALSYDLSKAVRIS